MRRLALVLGLALAAASAIWTQRLARDAEERFPRRGERVPSLGGELHVVERGSGAPVVLLHGVFGGAEDWLATSADELARSHRVLVFDRPGQGRSDRCGDLAATPAGQARLVREALARMGVERPLVVGFSFGGAVAAAYAVQFPDELSGLVLVSAVLYEWPGATSLTYPLVGLPLAGPLLARTILAPIGTLASEGSVARAFSPAPIAAGFGQSPLPLALRPESFLASAQDMRLLKASLRAQSPLYASIRAPTTIVCGDGDVVTWASFHSERLAREIVGARLVRVEGGGHQLPYSHPHVVNAAIAELSSRAR